MPMMNELMGWSFHFCFMPYGAQHQRNTGVIYVIFKAFSKPHSTGEQW